MSINKCCNQIETASIGNSNQGRGLKKALGFGEKRTRGWPRMGRSFVDGWFYFLPFEPSFYKLVTLTHKVALVEVL
jgi:hypothetical protein